MSWAARRRLLYLTGVAAFFLVVVGGPVTYKIYTSIPPACAQGTLRPVGQTSGPCSILDENYLQPYTVLWARSFRVRDGSYNAAAYIQNSNSSAGVEQVPYHFGLYDAQNLIIAEREGTTPIMPGTVTPVFEPRIDTGNRIVAHTHLEVEKHPVWKRMKHIGAAVTVNNIVSSNEGVAPRVSATAQNTSVSTISNVQFMAVVFDVGGNAFAASQTVVPTMQAGQSSSVVFTWPEPLPGVIGRIDILPIVQPRLVQ